MTRVLYLHDVTNQDNPGGTLPGGTNIAGLTITVTATGASTNRLMDETVGTSGGTSIGLSTSAVTTAQTNWFRRWMSRRLEAQTIASQNITLDISSSESNTNSDMFENGRWYLALWRPSTGAIVTTMINSTALITEPGTGETLTSSTVSSTAATAQGGDVLVLEVFSAQSQAMGTSYTNTIFYDGTSPGTGIHESALIFTNELVMQSLEQSVNYGSTAVLSLARKAWHRRRSGIFVPDLWIPEGAVI